MRDEKKEKKERATQERRGASRTMAAANSMYSTTATRNTFSYKGLSLNRLIVVERHRSAPQHGLSSRVPKGEYLIDD